ncbi:flagellar filament capping protein FliD [Paragemmobacter straminiformis]|uniref:Flagellar hook-associated protein 2 n=1 Tax=Paragemmobacter straminiformis TaxID=2045119 RepID=A0A842I3M7_9RHOB|nr:flagellar filament capping protein FliD [Gemmobacter straminiformis]MBC2834762.1 flagellar filament capping protein FliD [Gemmobacter straminiformis]
MAVDILSTLNKNGSGLSLTGLTASLVAAEITPQQKSQQGKIDTANLSISTLGQVRAQFQSLQGALTALNSTPILKATSGHSGVAVTVTDPGKIVNTTRSIGVVQTASRQVLEFKGFASADTLVGAGQLQMETGAWFEDANGGKSFAVNPDSTVNTMTIPDGVTLSQLAETLDALDGVSARVIDKGNGTFSLGVVSEAGAGSALRFTASETVAGLSAFDTTLTNDTVQIQAAQDAVLEVDGIAVFRPGNTIDDLIPGATLDISAPAGTKTTIGFSRDIETARGNLSYLVEQVNATRAKLNEVSARSVNGSTAGALAGDQVIEAMKQQLSRLIAAPITGFGAQPVYLSDLGVTTQRDGTLKLKALDFETAFKADPAKFDAVFANRLGASTAGVEVRGLVGAEAKSGAYDLVVNPDTGSATLDGYRTLGMTLSDGRKQFAVLDGPLSGLIVNAPADVTETKVLFGRSFLSSIDGLMTAALTGGGIGTREDQLGSRITEANTKLAELDVRAAKLEKRYLSRFTAMEASISTMKSTGNYLTNLVAQWNKSG